MKTYLVTYEDNYGLGVVIVNAEDEDEAKEIAVDNVGWEDYMDEPVEIVGTVKGIEHNEQSRGS